MMKQNSSLSIIIAFMLVFSTSTSWFATNHQVNAEIYSFVKQYYECKKLKMIITSDLLGDEYYYPDPSVRDNSLDDSFYKSLRLDTMSFDDSMDLLRGIYGELDEKCTSEFCECVRKRKTGDAGGLLENFGVFFQDDNFAGVKEIIVSLDRRLAADRESFEKSEYTRKYLPEFKSQPTLSKFAYNNDFTEHRTNQFKNYFNCYTYDVEVN